MKNDIRRLLALAAVSILITLMPFGALAANTLQAVIDAESGNTVTLNSAFILNNSGTVDLKGKTLKLKDGENNYIKNGAAVTIKNGTIDISGVYVGGDCIIGIGDYSTSGSLTLDNVTVSGEDYSSAFGILYVYGNSSLTIQNGSKIDVKGDKASGGGVIKTTGGNSTVTIKDTELIFNDAKRGIVSQASNDTLLIQDSTVTITDMKHGMSLYSPVQLKNTDMTMSNLSGHGIALVNPAAGVRVSEGSNVNISGTNEGAIVYEGIPVIEDSLVCDELSVFAFEDVKQSDNGNSFTDLNADQVKDLVDFKQDIEFTENGGFIIKGNKVPSASVPVVSLPQTGDTSNLLLWAAFMALAGAGMLTLNRVRNTGK